MSNDATIDKDLDNRLSKASTSFGRLYKRVWNSHSLRLTTKIKVYRAVVIPTLIYGAETWTLYRRQVRLLERFHQRCLRSILNIKWHDYVSNEDVLEKAELPSVESILLKQQLHWAGHVARMEDSRMPKAVLFGELKAGKRNRGAPKKRYKDQLKKQFSLAKIDKRGGQQSRRQAKSLKSRAAAQRGKKDNARKTGRCFKIRPHHLPSSARDAAGPVHHA